MPFLHLFLVLTILGFVVYLLTTFVPMDPSIRQMIRMVAIIIALVLVLHAFGIEVFSVPFQ